MNLLFVITFINIIFSTIVLSMNPEEFCRESCSKNNVGISVDEFINRNKCSEINNCVNTTIYKYNPIKSLVCRQYHCIVTLNKDENLIGSISCC